MKKAAVLPLFLFLSVSLSSQNATVKTDTGTVSDKTIQLKSEKKKTGLSDTDSKTVDSGGSNKTKTTKDTGQGTGKTSSDKKTDGGIPDKKAPDSNKKTGSSSDVTVKEKKKKSTRKVVERKKKTVIKKRREKKEKHYSAQKGVFLFVDDDYKMHRIPGYRVKKDSDSSFVHVTEDDTTSKNEKKGLFGLSRSSTDTLIRVSLIVLVLFIIVLYRMRYKKTNRRVLNSLPKK